MRVASAPSALSVLCLRFHPMRLALQDDVVQQEYSAAYSRLIFAVPPSRFAFPAVEDLRQYAGQALLRVSAANPGLLPRALAESVVATTVQSYAAAAGGTIS